MRRLPAVTRLCRQPCILDRHADGEVIQALECVPVKAQRLVDGVVVGFFALCVGGLIFLLVQL